MKAPSREQLQNLGSLITYDVGGKTHCLGFLLRFDGRGCFEPNFGKLDITTEEAEKHNQALSTAMIDGMDNQCAVGQYGSAYYQLGKGVTTFTGELIASSHNVEVKGKHITFTRKGRTFTGRLQEDSNSFNFRRTA